MRNGEPLSDYERNGENTELTSEQPRLSKFGRYTLVRHLASGGMAELHVARSRDEDALVVIKRIRAELAGDPRIVQMFLDEARVAATLRHPNIARTLDVSREDGHFYLAMEFLRGANVSQLMRRLTLARRALPLRHALAIVIGVCRGLHYAHTMCDDDGAPLDIVHRDISPPNIFVTFEGVPKIVDFGIAKAAICLTQTRPGALKGKLHYMSPEQCRSANLDRRTDIFSLSIILWELTTGVRLYRGRCDLDIMTAIVEGSVPRPSEVCPDYPAELERIVMRGLSPDVNQRYQCAADLQHDLERFAANTGLDVTASGLSGFVRQVFADEEAIDQLNRDAQAPLDAAGEDATDTMCARRMTTPEGGVELVTRCETVDQFVARFRRFCTGDSMFVPTAEPVPLGVQDRISIRLRTGERVLSGVGEVIESQTASSAAGTSRMAGMRIRFIALDADSQTVFQWLAASQRLRSHADEQQPNMRAGQVRDVRSPGLAALARRAAATARAHAARSHRAAIVHATAFGLGLLLAYRIWGAQ